MRKFLIVGRNQGGSSLIDFFENPLPPDVLLQKVIGVRRYRVLVVHALRTR